MDRGSGPYPSVRLLLFQELNFVEDEIQEKEDLLSKLRQTLGNYHEMRNRYEKLVKDLDGLEHEKVGDPSYESLPLCRHPSSCLPLALSTDRLTIWRGNRISFSASWS